MDDEKKTIEIISQISPLNPIVTSDQLNTISLNRRRSRSRRRRRRRSNKLCCRHKVCYKCLRFSKLGNGIVEHIVNKFDDVILVTGYAQYSFGISPNIHTYKGACSLIKYSKLACDYLTNLIGYHTNFKILLNSTLNKYGTKDHIHAWITVVDDNTKIWYDQTYKTCNGKHVSLKSHEGTAQPISPYKNDYIYVVNRKTQNIFNDTDEIQSFFNQLHNGFNECESFYIFIHYKTDMDYFSDMRISR